MLYIIILYTITLLTATYFYWVLVELLLCFSNIERRDRPVRATYHVIFHVALCIIIYALCNHIRTHIFINRVCVFL